MLFNTLPFLVFFLVVTTLYFLLPHKVRWMLLLSASCYFYMAFVPRYILILGAAIVVNYVCGVSIERLSGPRKQAVLLAGIAANIGTLFIFKYFNFFNDNLAQLARWLHWNYSLANLSLILPIGLSFHTFQSLGYLIDVNRGAQKAERHFGIFALFVMFYPQLVAGPIERSKNLLQQFYTKQHFDYDRVVAGLKLMIWGLFKKMVIADRVSLFVSEVYGHPQNYPGIVLAFATLFFAIQIYCDFSGYTDIAIGAANVMGFTLMQNFRQPYFSRSISEFWRRWHISLSTWFKDYLYIPLGGNRVVKSRLMFNLMVTFVVSGIWHGANWTYLIWGALNGLYLILSVLTVQIRSRLVKLLCLNRVPVLHQLLQMMLTFVFICFAWIFFRAASLSQALVIINRMMQFNTFGNLTNLYKVAPKEELILNFALIVILFIFDLFQEQKEKAQLHIRLPLIVRWVCYYVVLFATFVLGVYNVAYKTSFIYFQF
ncbi:MAG: putative rane protein involved in D-alanine export [Bacilli bacterium]|nr:putative rane protein involved in D-alanine export [Bacilli bacterium]